MSTNSVVHAVTTGDYRRWHLFWLIWFTASVGVFFAVEIYGLVTDWHRTLSAAVWSMERAEPGQPLRAWTAFHFLFIGVLAVLFLWLIFHFGFMWWRS